MEYNGALRSLKDNVADKDAFVTGKLKEAGAILLGKLSTHEFALGGPSLTYLGRQHAMLGTESISLAVLRVVRVQQ